uniref:Uncharacterized protein n=1 Tax=Romanomermis culicivorax TaxID=13658 RepID=A0A915HH17_ROMCU
MDLADGQADVAGILKSLACCIPTDYSGAHNQCGRRYFFRRDDHINGGSQLIDSAHLEGGRGYGSGRVSMDSFRFDLDWQSTKDLSQFSFTESFVWDESLECRKWA